jgi:hypothetical protein
MLSWSRALRKIIGITTFSYRRILPLMYRYAHQWTNG